MTALGATTSQHLTTVFGGHTSAETMDTLALEHAGLKSTFHEEYPRESQKKKLILVRCPSTVKRFDQTFTREFVVDAKPDK
jgi:hypothetical protein